MKELLFGWIYKGQFELSFLNEVMCLIEVFVILPIILFIIVSIYDFIKSKCGFIKSKFGGKNE